MVAHALPKHRFISPDEYLARERAAETKSEYLRGEIYAMSGGSPEHSTIIVNVTAAIVAQLKGKPCRAHSSDMKVRSTTTGLYSYPDLSVVCGEVRFHDERRDVLVNPTAIVEVLSPSTERFDRGKKFAQYQQIETFRDYLLISQEEPRVEHFSRDDKGGWYYRSIVGLDGQVTIPSIGCTLLLSDVYDRVEFPPVSTAPAVEVEND